MSLLIVGSVAYDNIKTPFESRENVLGGSATHSALAASFFTSPAIVAVVGEDFLDSDKKILADKNINLEALSQVAGKTFRWGGEYSFDMNSRTTLFTELNVFEQFNPRVPEALKNSDYVFLGNLHPRLQLSVLHQVANPKFVALDTMNYWIDSAKPELREVLVSIHALIINESEAREFTGEHNIVRAAAAILSSMDAAKNPLLIIKRGEYGVLMFQNGKTFFLPAYPLEDVADPTGAGDTFAGGFMGFLAAEQKHDWETYKKACVAGSALASFCVEKIGTQRLQEITEADIASRLREFSDLTEFETLG